MRLIIRIVTNMGYFSFFLIAFIIFVALAIIPGVISAAIAWSISKGSVKRMVAAFFYPYLFVTVFSLILFLGGLIVYNANGLDFIPGDVREVPLEQKPISISMMDYDMYNANLIHPDVDFPFYIDEIASENSDELFFHKSESEYDISNIDSTTVDTEHSYGKVIARTGEVVWLEQNDPVIDKLEWYTPKHIYDTRTDDLVGGGIGLSAILALVIAALACWGIKLSITKNKEKQENEK